MSTLLKARSLQQLLLLLQLVQPFVKLLHDNNLTVEQAQEYLAERVRVHQLAREVLPECSPAERWAKPDRWALMKDGRKSAVKLFDDQTVARDVLELAGKGHSVVKRPGASTRCAFYCNAAPFCDQAKALNQTEMPAT